MNNKEPALLFTITIIVYVKNAAEFLLYTAAIPTAVQVCDATMLNSGNGAGNKKNIGLKVRYIFIK